MSKIYELRWNFSQEGVGFTLHDGIIKLDIMQWGKNAAKTSNGPANLGVILGRLNEDGVLVDKESVILSMKTIASLSPNEAKQIGLPPPLPHRLQVQSSGAIGESNFSMGWKLIDQNGMPVYPEEQNGTFLKINGKFILLHNHVYEFIKGIDDFNKYPEKGEEVQVLAWGRLMNLIPEGTIISDQRLSNMNIVVASSFTLDLFSDIEFAPKLTHLVQPEDPNSEPTYIDALTTSRHKIFVNLFKSMSKVNLSYNLGDNWYVSIPKEIQHHLQTLKEFLKKSPEKRRAFSVNPKQFLNESSGEYAKENIEDIFVETENYLSMIIKYLGVWIPQAMSFQSAEKRSWLPADNDSIRVNLNEGIYDIPLNKLRESIPDLEKAINEKISKVNVSGKTIFATPENLVIIIKALNYYDPTRKYFGAKPIEAEKAKGGSPLVPILHDNIEDLEVIAQASNKHNLEFYIPPDLETHLLAHQAIGVRWLQQHWNNGSKGALLADDMGLGKTLQSLTFLKWIGQQTLEPTPFLIVVPTELLKNWEKEVKLHFKFGMGYLLRAYGAGLEELKSLDSQTRITRFRNANWVMTTYKTLRDAALLFSTVHWSAVVFDECQNINNPSARMTHMAKSLEADFTLMMTGTPVVNQLSELWCIYDGAIPGLLGIYRDFEREIEAPAKTNATVLNNLKNKLEGTRPVSVLLKRMKKDPLKGLPDREFKEHRALMSTKQSESYSRVVEVAKESLAKKGSVFRAIQDIRKRSLIFETIPADGIDETFVEANARLRLMRDILDEIKHKEEKALIFCDFLNVMDALVPYLQTRYHLKKPPSKITGKVSNITLKKCVDSFQDLSHNNFGVMLMTPQTVEVGLTLTNANDVIHLSRWWNPAVEDKCNDMVYQIGQKNDVTVHLPFAVHPDLGEKSFDINLNRLLESKRELSRRLMAPATTSNSELNDLILESS